MTPQVNLDGQNRAAEAQPTVPTTAPTPTTEQMASAAPHVSTYAERQGLMMAWVGMALGTLLLLGGLALWGAVALNAGFGGWLIATAVLGIVMVAVIVAVNFTVLRPGR